MQKPIILLSGGTGVGTSTYSFELAKTLNISSVISTDSIREVIRSIIAKEVNPFLEKSTYLSGKTIHYNEKSEEVRKSEILRAYKTQCTSINVGVEAVIKRALSENIPLIVEGVHLIPGRLRESEIYKENKSAFFEYLIYISNSSKHKQRFIQRQKEAPSRKLNKYIDNFKEIRWINDYLVDKAKAYGNICLIDNSRPLREGLNELLKYYYSRSN